MLVHCIRQASAARSTTRFMQRSMSSTPENKFFLLHYNFVDNILTRRVQVRSEHLEHALKSKKNGHLVMGGAVANPPDGAFVVFKAPDQHVVEDFAKNDPYVREDLVTSYSIREWTVAI